MNKQAYSKCCFYSVRLYSGEEGTNHYICNACDEACDVVYSQTKKHTPMGKPAWAEPKVDKEAEQLDKIILDLEQAVKSRKPPVLYSYVRTYRKEAKQAIQAYITQAKAEAELAAYEDVAKEMNRLADPAAVLMFAREFTRRRIDQLKSKNGEEL